jgi:hypothetical protein
MKHALLSSSIDQGGGNRRGEAITKRGFSRHHHTLLHLWEQPRPIGCSFSGANSLGEDHDKISTDRSGGGLVGGRSYLCHGSKWSTHTTRISRGGAEPQSLWPLWLLSPPSLLCLSPLSLPPSVLLAHERSQGVCGGVKQFELGGQHCVARGTY